MQSTDAINLTEVVLRDLIRDVLGDAWIKVPDVDLEKLEASRQNETERRRGAIVSLDLLDFADFLLLQHIITNQWEKFKPVLKSSKHFKVYMDRLGAFRNTSMHSRVLLPFEEALVVGMTGEIRNEVTVWRSTRGPDMNYYPEITSVTDSHGVQTKRNTKSGLVLRPGDVVSFACVGTDPQGRELKWRLRVLDPTFTYDEVDVADGDEVMLTWTVATRHIRDDQLVMISLVSSGEYHRLGDHDALVTIRYKVEPPV